jgi:hypothetical protein
MLRPPRICFLFIAQTHQVLHSLPIAMAMSSAWPEFEVHLAASSQSQLDYVDDVLRRLDRPPMRGWLLGPAWLRDFRHGAGSVPPKVAMLMANLHRIAGYDAVVTPERPDARAGQPVRRPPADRAL